MEKLQRQVNALKIYAGILTVIVLVLIVVNILQLNRPANFKEINAERINIVEKDGTLRMAISNKERQDPGSYNGKKIAKRDRPAGMIFFNDDGDECGGLVYDGDKKSASMTYSIDQYKGDQIMQLQYAQEKSGSQNLLRSYGLKMWDRDDRFPTARLMDYVDSLKKLNDTNAYKAGIEKIRAAGWLGKERLFVGKTTDGETGMFLRDDSGKPRLKIYISKQNQPVIEFLDKNGAVISSATKR
jgi:hypothetical protein